MKNFLLSVIFATVMVSGGEASEDDWHDYDLGGLKFSSPHVLKPHDAGGFGRGGYLTVSYWKGQKKIGEVLEANDFKNILNRALGLFVHPNFEISSSAVRVPSDDGSGQVKFQYLANVAGKPIRGEIFLFEKGRDYWILKVEYRDSGVDEGILQRFRDSIVTD